MPLLEGARALVIGVANERSIAWGIAQALAREGARLGFTYLGETLERRVRPLAESLSADLIAPCDVQDDAQIDALFAEVDRVWGGLDVLIHAVAFANREDLSGRFLDTSRQGFHLALDVSAYSLVALARASAPRMKNGGSILTLSFAGSQRVFPNYNVMGVAKAALEAEVRYLAAELGESGIRVNAISAGPIKTLSAAGIKGFRDMLHYAGERSPLKRNVSLEDVAGMALALVGPGGAGVTGQVIYVDAGLSILGV
ncbi:MAG TPA: enoyl-ACP reductase [Candidatus Binatia bacterium]